jgi:hypothetical protein
MPSPIISRGPWWARVPLGTAVACTLYGAGLLLAAGLRRLTKRWSARQRGQPCLNDAG